MAKCPECESDLELDGYELDVGETIELPGVLDRARRSCPGPDHASGK